MTTGNVTSGNGSAPSSNAGTAPSSNGASASGNAPANSVPTGNGSAPSTSQPKAGQQLTNQQVKYLYERMLPDGNKEQIDISDFKHKVKIDGIERELSLAEAYKLQGLEKSSFKRFEEASNLKKQIEKKKEDLAFIQKTLNDPKAVWNHFKNLVPREALQQLITNELKQIIEYQKLPPEVRAMQDKMSARERQLAEKEAQLRKLEKMTQEQQAAAKKAQTKKQIEAVKSRWPSEIVAQGVPNDPAIIAGVMKETANLLINARKTNYDLSEKEAIRIAIDHFKKQTTGIFKGANPDALANWLGQETISKIAGQRAAQLNQQPGRVAQDAVPAAPAPKKEEKPIRMNDLRKKLGLT